MNWWTFVNKDVLTMVETSCAVLGSTVHCES